MILNRERIEVRFRADRQRWAIEIVSDEAHATLELLPVSAKRAQPIARACDEGRRSRLAVYAPNEHDGTMEMYLRSGKEPRT